MPFEKRTYTVVGIVYSNDRVVSYGTFYVAAQGRVDAIDHCKYEIPGFQEVAVFAGKQDDLLHGKSTEWLTPLPGGES